MTRYAVLAGLAMSLVSCLAQSRGRWTTLSTNGNPTARHEAAMAEHGGKLYLIGGRGVKPVEEFDPKTSTWRQLGPTPLEIHHFQPVVYNNLIYVMTAMTGNYPKETPLETVYIYDPKLDSWRKGPEVPSHRRRGGAGTVVHNRKIYLVAGIIDGHTSGTVAWLDEFDPQTETWRELPDAPRARDHFPALVSGGKLYCVGGRNTSYHTPDSFTAFFGAVIPEVDVYDFATGQWTTLPEGLPVPTAAGGLAGLDGDIYYFGGETAQKQAHRQTQWLDVKSGHWNLAASLVQGRHGGGAAVLNGRIYFAAGSGGRGGGPELSSTEVFTLKQP
jgi:N-acetylneuraminic acid mutarotase